MKPTSSTLRWLSATLLVVVLAELPALAQKKGKKVFSEATSVMVVEVPVTVTRDNVPVHGLTAANFELFDGKTKQEISGFEILDRGEIETPEPSGRALPIAARRHFLLLFDLAWSKPEAVVEARRAARDFAGRLHPTDLAAVALFTSSQGADLLLHFTSDRRQLELAIETLGVPSLVEPSSDPLRLVFGNALEISRQSPAGSSPDEITGAQILETLHRLVAAERAARLNKVQVLTGQLEALADLLASVDARKHLVYFSEGVPNEILLGRKEIADQHLGRREQATDAGSWLGEVASQNLLGEVVERFRRADCAIQSVDISGLRPDGPRQSGKESLASLARGTGGDLVRDFDHLGEAMRPLLERTSVTYLLAFQPRNLKRDGEYHDLKVKLVDAPPGARVSHRAGYYAPRPHDQIAPHQLLLETAELILSAGDGGPIDLDILAVPLPVAGQRAYVPLLFEIGGTSLLATDSRPKLELEIYAYATNTETGNVDDFFLQPVGLDLKKVRAALEQSGIKYWGHFDLPAGRYTARVMVRRKSDGRHTLKRQTFTVASLESSEALLLPPLFPEPPGKWLIVREGENRQRDVAYPSWPAARPTSRLPGR